MKASTLCGRHAGRPLLMSKQPRTSPGPRGHSAGLRPARAALAGCFQGSPSRKAAPSFMSYPILRPASRALCTWEQQVWRDSAASRHLAYSVDQSKLQGQPRRKGRSGEPALSPLFTRSRFPWEFFPVHSDIPYFCLLSPLQLKVPQESINCTSIILDACLSPPRHQAGPIPWHTF